MLKPKIKFELNQGESNELKPHTYARKFQNDPNDKKHSSFAIKHKNLEGITQNDDVQNINKSVPKQVHTTEIKDESQLTNKDEAEVSLSAKS